MVYALKASKNSNLSLAALDCKVLLPINSTENFG
jgi:hypothetical protein